MKFKLNVLIAFMLLGLTYSCFDDGDDNIISASEINDFVWKGMNAVYLYKDNMPDLSDDRFSSNQEYADYLNSFSTPEGLFENLIYQRETVDRFSWIVDDYIALEQLLSGVSKRNGMEFNLFFVPGSTTDIFGIVRLVLPNSDASNQNLLRGQIFNMIDGNNLTIDNYIELLGQESYSIGLATYNDNGTPEVEDDTIVSGSETIALTEMPYTENPVFKTSIIDVDGENVGYLMYNGFTSNFDRQLNDAFGVFASNNVQHLVLDLRYNPGGSVNTASLLGSMITGQFNGQVFAKLQYNNDLQSNNFDFDFSSSLDNGNAINSLNLNKVYVLATRSSASASEMIINSLNAYINVVQIGTNTTGKSQASITVYDSPNLQREGANPSHTYAMQPLVAITVNKNNQLVPSTGLVPSTELKENPSNYGVLGNINEPLLAAAIADIQGTGRFSFPDIGVTPFSNSDTFIPHINEMYIDNKTITVTTERIKFNQ